VSGCAPTAEYEYYHFNPVSSTVGISKANGLLLRERYNSYGSHLATNISGQANTEFNNSASVRYAGHVTDDETGLIYMRARYYDPAIARFISVDPIGFNLGSIQSFNRYAYANNNPNKFVDPDGRAPFSVTRDAFKSMPPRTDKFMCVQTAELVNARMQNDYTDRVPTVGGMTGEEVAAGYNSTVVDAGRTPESVEATIRELERRNETEFFLVGYEGSWGTDGHIFNAVFLDDGKIAYLDGTIDKGLITAQLKQIVRRKDGWVLRYIVIPVGRSARDRSRDNDGQKHESLRGRSSRRRIPSITIEPIEEGK
jgi:RHS repeat-associated protein